jgi:hypothetical protein
MFFALFCPDDFLVRALFPIATPKNLGSDAVELRRTLGLMRLPKYVTKASHKKATGVSRIDEKRSTNSFANPWIICEGKGGKVEQEGELGVSLN